MPPPGPDTAGIVLILSRPYSPSHGSWAARPGIWGHLECSVNLAARQIYSLGRLHCRTMVRYSADDLGLEARGLSPRKIRKVFDSGGMVLDLGFSARLSGCQAESQGLGGLI